MYFSSDYGHEIPGTYCSFPTRHQAIDHFRMRHVYHWNLVSVPKQVYSCLHCQFPFHTWAELNEHILSEHNGYGLYYREPDYVAVSSPEDEDQLSLLPCTVCNDFYHDQVNGITCQLLPLVFIYLFFVHP